MNGDLGKQYLKDYIEKTESLLEKYLDEKSKEAHYISKITGEAVKRFKDLSLKGKRIRGSLVTLGYQIAGKKVTKKILDASLFIELFHTAVLIHDDIMDQDSFRRGIPTIHTIFEKKAKSLNVLSDPTHYGESIGVNTGDFGLFYAYGKLLNSKLPKEALIKVCQLFSEYIIRVVYGQILDVTNTSVQNLDEKDILKVHRYKSAEYTGVLPLLAGASLGGIKNKANLEALEKYGLAFGWAFQIQDDTIGLFGKEEETEKPVGSDLEEGKNTLFMLHLSQHGTKEQKAFQKRILGRKGIRKSEVKKMCQILKDSGSYDYVIDLGWKYVEEGKRYISKITKNRNLQDILESLIVYMMERTK